MPHTPSQFRRFRRPAFWLALLLLLGVGIASVLGVVKLQASNEAIERSYQTLRLIEGVDRHLRTTEASARAYRLTGHEGYRDHYLHALPQIEEATQQLAAGTSHNPRQRERALLLQKLAEERVSDMQRLFSLQENAGIPAAQNATNANQILSLSSEIDAHSRQMRSEETAVLQVRQAASRRHTLWLIVFVVLGMLMSTALLVALTTSLSRENRRARALEREAREAVRAMQATIAQRDRLSEQRHQLSRYSSLLQSCANRDEIMQLTATTIPRLVPGASGQCYVLRASHDFYESAATFGTQVVSSGDLLVPNQCWALRRGQPHYVVPDQDGMHCAHVDTDARRRDLACLCTPLIANGAAIGLLHVSATASGDPEDADASIVATLAEQLGLALANLQLRETLQLQSLHDPLTGLFNRRYLQDNLARELYRCERRALPLSVLMLDIDHFKRFNDTHGHAAGDALLGHVGRVIAGAIRAEDMACRYGGEEFTLVLPETDAATAFARAEAIRGALETTTLVHLRQTLGPITASIGLSTYPGDGTTAELLLQVADAWLYRAKAEGRNRTLPDPGVG